jgi:hypothetical protein
MYHPYIFRAFTLLLKLLDVLKKTFYNKIITNYKYSCVIVCIFLLFFPPHNISLLSFLTLNSYILCGPHFNKILFTFLFIFLGK